MSKFAAGLGILVLSAVGLFVARGGLHNPQVASTDSGTEILLSELNAEAVNPSFSVFDLSFQDAQGKRINFSDLKGRVVLVNFWATWCPPCRLEMPSMEALNRELGSEGLVILAVNVREGANEVKAFFQEHSLSFPAIMDEKGEIFERFNVWSLPTTFLINKKGEPIGKVTGFRDWHDEKTLGVLRGLLEEQV